MSIRNAACGLILWLSFPAGVSMAQNTELTSGDNHALLYAHQLGFAQDGAPTVRMRIADGLKSFKFTPGKDFIVMPSGVGGPTITLRGDQTYEVKILNSAPGRYQYGAILARSELPGDLDGAREYCTGQKFDTEIVSVGSIFALRGSVFDNRENLLMTRRAPDKKTAEKYRNFRLPDELCPGEEDDTNEIYSELESYPTGMMVLRNESGSVEIANKNLLWIDFGEHGAVFHDLDEAGGRQKDIEINSQVIVTPDSGGEIAVVQSADIETILRGIVPSEIFASAPEGALMAQAIAARTTLVAQVGARHLADPYHLCNKQHCQVYRGLSGADRRTDAAIKKTRGQILMSGKKLVQAYYSAHCGGMSAGADETWGLPEKTYLATRSDDRREAAPSFEDDAEFMTWWNGKPDNYCGGAPAGKKSFTSTKHARWTSKVSVGEIEKSLKKAGVSLGRLTDVEVVDRGKSYRAVKIRLRGTKGEHEVARELPIRRFFGGLRSALFVMHVNKSGKYVESVDFNGAGFGHGVGMCQTGAIGMAQRGIGAEEILKHYYPGTELRSLY